MRGVHIPVRFAEQTGRMFGDRGVEWIANLPTLLANLGLEWGFQVGPPVTNLSFNYVMPVTIRDGTEAVLKVGVPGEELCAEISALAEFDGKSCVRLLRSDHARGAMLLERVRPGNELDRRVPDALVCGGSVLAGLWRDAPDNKGLPTLSSWCRGLAKIRSHYGDGVGPFPSDLLAEAESLAAELLQTSAPMKLLHGDLHTGNILSSERAGWLAIDPKGVIGEPAYDVATFLSDLEIDLETAVPTIAHLTHTDVSRVLKWGVVRNVLSAWWCVEDRSDGFDGAISKAQRFRDCL